MRRLWKWVTLLGVDGSIEPAYRKYIKLANIIAVVTGLWLVSFTPSLAFYLPEALLILIINFCLLPLIALIPFMNYRRKYLVAKHLYGVISTGAIIAYTMVAGIETNIHGYSLLVVVGSFLLFSDREQKYIYTWAVISVILYFTLEYLYAYHLEPFLELDDDFINFARLNLFGMFFVIVFLLMGYSNNIVRGAEKDLQEEKRKADELLLNILPHEIAEELKEKGSALPVRHDSVSVLFTDFVGFTHISEQMSAEEVIDELDKCFSQFDEITRHYKLEKIKTIGDSYMLAGGLPASNNTHAIDCVLGALEIQAFMKQMQQIKEEQGLPYWQLRLGIHTGPLVAGVIGQMKFIYDVFGDTVNTASRLESSGEAGQINISRQTHDQVKFLFECQHRGRVMAKNKGEIDMYFVTGIKPRFSMNAEGRVPNERFKDIYARVEAGARLVARD